LAGKIKAGQTSDYVGAFWDFLPTFAELSGQSLPFRPDGVSVLPLLLNKGKQKQHGFLYWEFHEDGGRQAVRMGNWKGIKEKVMKSPGNPIALYDLSKDPKESTDLAGKYPEIVKKIQGIMLSAHIEEKNFPFITGKT
jgi:arylsulfatase A